MQIDTALYSFVQVKATGAGGPKIIISLSERSYWAVQDVEDRINKHCSKPKL